ncbi:MAG: hypothetical protein LC808_39385, partial [Actinobacteria bacterium]|nr:hypothetical protein [Actinomycetota bacterium]
MAMMGTIGEDDRTEGGPSPGRVRSTGRAAAPPLAQTHQLGFVRVRRPHDADVADPATSDLGD